MRENKKKIQLKHHEKRKFRWRERERESKDQRGSVFFFGKNFSSHRRKKKIKTKTQKIFAHKSVVAEMKTNKFAFKCLMTTIKKLMKIPHVILLRRGEFFRLFSLEEV